jgi:hypothetical protein
VPWLKQNSSAMTPFLSSIVRVNMAPPTRGAPARGALVRPTATPQGGGAQASRHRCARSGVEDAGIDAHPSAAERLVEHGDVARGDEGAATFRAVIEDIVEAEVVEIHALDL